jgi:hypothetical protein
VTKCFREHNVWIEKRRDPGKELVGKIVKGGESPCLDHKDLNQDSSADTLANQIRKSGSDLNLGRFSSIAPLVTATN